MIEFPTIPYYCNLKRANKVKEDLKHELSIQLRKIRFTFIHSFFINSNTIITSEFEQMSKMHSIKQDKRYRNETINILYHLQNKSGIPTPTLIDKSIRSIKNNKNQQVQSSRLSTKNDYSLNHHKMKRTANSKSRQQRLHEISEKNIDRNSSKSLSSKNGKNYEVDKTKKNSYSKMHTEHGRENNSWDSIVEKHFEKRMKGIQKIFMSIQSDEEAHGWVQSHRSINSNKTNPKLHKKSNSYSKLQGSGQKRFQYQSLEEALSRLSSRFKKFDSLMEDRKMGMIYDEFDQIFSHIVHSMREQFGTILDLCLKENHQKFTDVYCAFEKIKREYENKIQKQKNQYNYHLEDLVAKSLFATDTMNQLQRNGLINFENEARNLHEKSILKMEEKNYFTSHFGEDKDTFKEQVPLKDQRCFQKNIQCDSSNHQSGDSQSYNFEFAHRPKFCQKIYNKKDIRKNDDPEPYKNDIEDLPIGLNSIEKSYSPILIKDNNGIWCKGQKR